MNNNKGQTLVEFVLVMPIFLLLIISLIDVANITFKKNDLNNTLDTVYDMYKDSKYNEIDSYLKEKNIKVIYTEKGSLTNIKLENNVKVISPIVITVLGSEYKIEADKDYYKG